MPSVRTLSQQLGQLKSRPARDFQHLGVFDLGQNFPYQSAIECLKSLSLLPCCLSKMSGIYKAHSLVLQEIS